jgi:molybdenum cofactor cytidylyltransferase
MGISVIILAAGLGRRMKGDKLHLELDGISLIDRVLSTVSRIGNLERIVVTNDQRIASKAASLGIIPVKNPDAPLGQSTSIHKGILSAREDTEGYLFVMGDQPFLTTGTLNRIVGAYKSSPTSIIVPVYGKDTGSPVLFPATLKDELLSLEGDNGGRQVLKAHGDLIRKVQIPSPDELMDVDTPEDYDRLRLGIVKDKEPDGN